jgi:hypothetical protein
MSGTSFFMAIQAFVWPLPLFNFLILYTGGRTPWTGDRSVARPLCKHRTTQTQSKHIHTPNIHALSGIRTHDSSFRASEDSSWLRPASVRESEDSSCLRPRGYRDRLASERAKTVHALDRAATVTGFRYFSEALIVVVVALIFFRIQSWQYTIISVI